MSTPEGPESFPMTETRTVPPAQDSQTEDSGRKSTLLEGIACFGGCLILPIVLILNLEFCHGHRFKTPYWIIGIVGIILIIIAVPTGIECSKGHCAGHKRPPRGTPSITTPSPPTVTANTSICLTTLGGSNSAISNNATGLGWGILAPVQIDSVLLTQAINLTKPSGFHIEFTGDPTNAYAFRAVDNSSLVVSTLNAPNLTLALPSSLDSRQYFNITCETCNSRSLTTGCVITAWVGGTCVEPQTSGEPLILAACDGQPHQKFDFVISAS